MEKTYRTKLGEDNGTVTARPCPTHAGQNGLLVIHGKRTVILLAASHVINPRHRELAAFSWPGIRRLQSYLPQRSWVAAEVSLLWEGHPR